MDIKEIKHFLVERGINKNFRIERNGGGQYLYNLLLELNDIVKKESKQKILKHLERYYLED